MATIELRLSNKVQKETGMSEVMICLRYSGKDLSAKSGIFINPSFFEYYIDRKKTTSPKEPIPDKNKATQKRAAKNGWVLRRCGEIVSDGRALQTDEVKEQYGKMVDLKKAIFHAFNSSNPKNLTSSWLQGIVNKFNNIDSTPNKPTFFELAEIYLKTRYGNQALTQRLTGGLRSLLKAVWRYESFVRATDKKRSNWVWDIDKVTREDIHDFMTFLKSEHELVETHPNFFSSIKGTTPPIGLKPSNSKIVARAYNTLVKMEKELKGIFTFLYKEGYTQNRPFEQITIGTQKYGTPVYITLDERNTIADADLQPGWKAIPEEEKRILKMSFKMLSAQRDIFIFQCHIGCRVSDLINLTERNIDNGILTYTPRKTKDSSEEQARIPLHPKALSLIEKYKGKDKKGRLFPFARPSRYNEAIKVIFKLSGITRNVEVRNPLTGENEWVPINTIASSHMARKTFIGNLYLKVQDPNLIGKMSGHVDGSRAFKRYRKIEDETLRNVIDLNG